MLLSLHLTQNYVINGREKTMRLIDADKLKEKVSKMMFENATGFGSFDAVGILEIDAAPTIDPESLRSTAKWVEAPDEGADGSWEACSRCAWESRWAASQYKYCPNCGARMVNEDEKHCT